MDDIKTEELIARKNHFRKFFFKEIFLKIYFLKIKKSILLTLFSIYLTIRKLNWIKKIIYFFNHINKTRSRLRIGWGGDGAHVVSPLCLFIWKFMGDSSSARGDPT